MGVRIGWAVDAVIAFVAFFLLGRNVVQHGEPAAWLAWEQSLVNHSTLIAWWFTWLCYPYFLIPIALALLVVAWRMPEWRGRIVLSIVVLLLCWQGADLFQHYFARPRRLDWVVKHETAFSFPSSHAAIAVGFYGLWAALLWTSKLPLAVRATAVVLLVALVVAICWSRLALGAHYVTDLAGGALLAGALASAAVALLPKVFGVPAGRT